MIDLSAARQRLEAITDTESHMIRVAEKLLDLSKYPDPQIFPSETDSPQYAIVYVDTVNLLGETLLKLLEAAESELRHCARGLRDTLSQPDNERRDLEMGW